MELLVHDDPSSVAEAVSRRIAELISETGDRFSLGAAGGGTPQATYRALRDLNPGWDKVVAWLSDERWVPPDDQRSNGRMVADALLDHVDAGFERPHWSEMVTPEDSAAHYEARLRSIHGESPPDLVLLGMGADGHTASLFPGTTAIEEQRRWYVANEVPELGETRLTATYPLLWRARLLLILVVGEEKAGALEASFGRKTPAGRLGDGDGVVEWHVDRAAASLLV
jgi:6-phosphogluconolactonase